MYLVNGRIFFQNPDTYNYMYPYPASEIQKHICMGIRLNHIHIFICIHKYSDIHICQNPDTDPEG